MPQNAGAESVSRRTYLKGTAGSAFLGALAGCAGSGGSNTLTVGGTVPQSGPYANIGKNQKKAIELAVKHANEENDAGDKTVEVKFADTKTDPQEGTKAARQLINDGADFLAGNFSSSVALAIGEIAQREDTIYTCIGGSNSITGSKCRPNVFNAGNSAVMQTSAALRYALEQGHGSSVYEISADYSWGQSIQSWNENHIVPNYDAEYKGNTFVKLGAGDYSQAISKAKNSGADIVSLNLFGGDHVKSARQAWEFDLFENAVCVWPATGIVEASQIGQNILSHENFYGADPWYWQYTGGKSEAFANSFHDEYGERPLGFSASVYVGVRTTLKAIAAADGTDSKSVRSELEDRKLFPQLWGVDERFRACDHRATIPTMTVKGRPANEVDGQNYFEVLQVPKNPEKTTMRTCDQTGCTF